LHLGGKGAEGRRGGGDEGTRGGGGKNILVRVIGRFENMRNREIGIPLYIETMRKTSRVY